MRYNLKKIAIIMVLPLLLGQALMADSDYGFLQKRVSLAVDNSPIEDVIRLLAKQNGFNVSVSGEELGEVSFILNDVPLSEALNSILNPNGLSWYVRNNVVVIKDAKTLSVDEIRTDIVILKYVSADEAKLAVQHLLTEGGKCEVLKEESNIDLDRISSKIVISDRMDVVRAARSVIDSLDKPMPLINISVKLVETTLSGDDRLGIDWPAALSGTFGGLFDEETGTYNLGIYPLEGGSWTWGKFSADEVSTALDFLIQRGNSRLLSDPNLTTVSNKPAQIAVTTTIPIQTINRFSEGAIVQDIVTYQDLDVGITLRVIPRVNEEGVITLKVNPIIEEIIGYTGPPEDQRPITSNRSMQTEVRVGHDETLVMGGLLKESKFETVNKLPLLGHIPLVGKLFQHHSLKTEQTDLTIFITPRVLEENVAGL